MRTNKFITKEVLALDSIYSFLTIYERHLCHLQLMGKTELTSNRIEQAKKIIIQERWEPPIWSYEQDRVLYCETKTGKQAVKYYKNEIENIINQKLR